MYALIDGNNFYASCERALRPDLEGKPIVVLSNNDGCAIARSNEAKALGIPMGAAAFKYRNVFKENRVQVFSANFPLYGDMSGRVVSRLQKFTPDIEVYSIDESFLFFKNYNQDLEKIGHEMRSDVLRTTRIPTSIGFAPTKALAKVANRIAKKFPEQTKGVYVIDSEQKRVKALKWLKVEDIWGIGRRYALKLESKGIHTAHQFTQCHDSWVQKYFTIVGLRLKKELEGKSVLGLADLDPKKNIACTRSFDKDYTQFDDLRERVSSFASICGQKLRKQNSCANALMIFVRSNSHKPKLEQYSRSMAMQLPYPTNSDIELSKAATKLLKRVFREDIHYKKAGVIVMDFCPANDMQLSLFNKHPKDGRFDESS